MPFNPDEYLAKKQAATAQESGNSAAKFNPDSYLQSKGVQTLPNQGNIQNGASTADKLTQMADQAGQAYQQFAPVAGQGAAMGYGKQLNAGIQSAAGAVDQLVNGQNNFGDQSAANASIIDRGIDAISNFGKNYERAKKSVSEQIQHTRNASPVAAALTEIASSIPAAIATGSALGSLGVTTPTAQAGIQGLAYGYGSSDKEGLSRLEEAGKAGAISAATAGLFQLAGKGIDAIKNMDAGKYLESEYGSYSNPIKAISQMEGSPTVEGGYKLNFKDSKMNHFELGREYKQALTDPNTQGQIASELNSQPNIAQQLIDKTREKLGTLKNAALETVPNVPVRFSENGTGSTKDLMSVFSDARKSVENTYIKGNPERAALQEALLSHIDDTENALLSQSGAKDLTGVTLQNLAKQQAQVGDIVFAQKAFAKDSVINGQAKSFFGKLANALNKTDEQFGTGGDISNINKVFTATYQMEDNMLNGATIKSLTDPQALSAQRKYGEFVKPFEQLSPEIRSTLAPELHRYLSEDFPKVFAKAKSMLVATERGAMSHAANKSILSLAGLKSLNNSVQANILNRAGMYTQGALVDGTTGSLQMLMNGAQQGLPMVAPAVGALSAPQLPPGQQQ